VIEQPAPIEQTEDFDVSDESITGIYVGDDKEYGDLQQWVPLGQSRSSESPFDDHWRKRALMGYRQTFIIRKQGIGDRLEDWRVSQ